MLSVFETISEQQITKEKINSINLEINLIDKITYTSKSKEENFKGISNLSQLAQRIKKANQNIEEHQKGKQHANQWLKSKGVNLRPLLQEIQRDKKNIVEEPVVQSGGETWKFVQLESINKNNIKQFSKIYQEINVKNSIVNSLTKKQPSDKMMVLRKAILNKRQNRNDHQNKEQSENRLQKQKNMKITPPRDQKYINCIDQCLLQFHQHSLSQLHLAIFQQFNDFEELQWIRLITSQIQSVIEAQRIGKNSSTFLALSSLNSVESLFRKILDTDQHEMLWFLRQNYPSEFQRNYNDRKADEEWGKAYLYYRAGKKDEFYKIIQKTKNIELLNHFKEYDNSIEAGQPCPHATYKNKWIQNDFFKQLENTLTGKYQIVERLIKNEKVYDQVWITLRSLGIYRFNDDKNDQYWSVIDTLFFECYLKDSKINLSKVVSLIALSAYNELIQYINENSTATILQFQQADYIHLLLLLYLNEQLSTTRDCDAYATIRRECFAKVIPYAKQLRERNIPQYYKYLYLLLTHQIQTNPDPQLTQQNILYIYANYFDSREDILSFDWRQFKAFFAQVQINQENLYQFTIKYVLDRFPKECYRDYLYLAKQYKQLLFDQHKSYSLLVEMRLRDAVENIKKAKSSQKSHAFDEEGMDYALLDEENIKNDTFADVDHELIQQFSLEGGQFSEENYTVAFNFFMEYTELTNAIIDKNYRFLDRKSTQKWRESSSNYQLFQILMEYLLEHESFIDLYLDYLIHIIAKEEIICHKSSAIDDLAKAKSKMKREVSTLVQKYPKIKSSQLLKQLKQKIQ